MRHSILSAAAAAGLCAGASAANAVDIKFASPTPPKAHLNVQVFGPWTKEVTAASGGTLNVQLIAGPILASHRNIFDRVRKNVAQIGWGLQALVPGQFPASSVVLVPGNFNSSVHGSIALWRLYEKGMLGNEYDDVKPLAIFSFPPFAIHTNVPVRKVSDLAGMKIGVNGKIGSQVLSSLGAVPISLAPPEYYQSISRGLVSGAFIAWTGVPPYRLQEVTKFTLEGPLGGQAGMIVMNKDVYQKLPAAGKKAIDDHSGETLVRRFSEFWDRIQSGSRKKNGAGPKHVTVTPSGAELQQMAEKLKAVERAWIEATPNGAELMDALKAEVAKAQSGG